jgi:hypothetical protein
MIGGVVTSAILGLLLYPVLYVVWRGRQFTAPVTRAKTKRSGQPDPLPVA